MSTHQFIREAEEFSLLQPCEQRFIRCSLEIAHQKLSRETIFAHWGRKSDTACTLITVQINYYGDYLLKIHNSIPLDPGKRPPDESRDFFGSLVKVSTCDLLLGSIKSYLAYRFLYERILSPRIRPWLPGAFMAAAVDPRMKADCRARLLQSVQKADVSISAYSVQEPIFYPEYIDKADIPA